MPDSLDCLRSQIGNKYSTSENPPSFRLSGNSLSSVQCSITLSMTRRATTRFPDKNMWVIPFPFFASLCSGPPSHLNDTTTNEEMEKPRDELYGSNVMPGTLFGRKTTEKCNWKKVLLFPSFWVKCLVILPFDFITKFTQPMLRDT